LIVTAKLNDVDPQAWLADVLVRIAGHSAEAPRAASGAPPVAKDTTYICVVDEEGNVFSSSPSDTTFDGPIIPGTGFCLSTRGSQSWAQPDHPSSVAPGKRPRLTPAPALAIKKGQWAMPFGTPGGDIQQQAMLQVFLNVALWGMDPQVAVEAPRFASYSFPDSFEPHDYFPRRLQVEGRIPAEVRASLQGLGHDVVDWPDWTYRAGAVCTILEDMRTGILVGGADPRRPGYALGW
jgi:gamma-glutamyltranspeptidase/glutathione hydrolase